MAPDPIVADDEPMPTEPTSPVPVDPTPHEACPPRPGATSEPRTPLSVVFAAIVLIATAPVVTWWVVGPQDEHVPGRNPDDYDRLFEPVRLGAQAELTVGLIATALAVAALARLVTASMHGRFDPRWWFTIIGFAAIGAGIGFGYRIVTAGVIGANIGGGIMILFGTPMILATFTASTTWAIRIARSSRRTG